MKYILSLVFVFLIQLSIIEAKSYSFSKESGYFIDHKGAFRNSGQVYGNLFYSIENDKLANIFCSSVFKFGFSSRENPDLDDAWKKLDDLGEAIIPASLRKDPNFLSKFDDVAKNNNFRLDADGVSNLLKSPTTKLNPSTFDNPEGVLDAIRRTSDAGVDGVSISHKKFPTPSEGSGPFVLKNAKQYQAEASGDAGLSFDKGGRSFDNVTSDGKLIDRKYGHGPSVFNEVDDGFGGKVITIKDQNRANSILQQAQAQVNAAGGSPIRWEISTNLGARGIRQLFDNPANSQAIRNIEVVYIPQVTIIP